MEINTRVIYSNRVLHTAVEQVYRAFADPALLKEWWGPEGFTNTIHEFDLRPGGNWNLTMHGPENGHYENSAVFERVEPNHLVRWNRISKPLFAMEIAFEALEHGKTKISFRMFFDTEEECHKLRNFVTPKNEENFDRLERLLKVL